MTTTDPGETQESEIMTGGDFLGFIDKMNEKLITEKDRVDRQWSTLDVISFYDHDVEPPTPRIVLEDGYRSLHIFYSGYGMLVLLKKPVQWDPQFPNLKDSIIQFEDEHSDGPEIMGCLIQHGAPHPVALVQKKYSNKVNEYFTREIKITDDNIEELGILLKEITNIIQNRLDALKEDQEKSE